MKDIKISDYDYPLPDDRIAKYPLPVRDQSKLLVYKNGEITETIFNKLDAIIPEGHLLVFNNTMVIPARLIFQKPTGALIEIFCLEPLYPSDYHESFQSDCCTWKCIVGNLKKWKEGTLEKEIRINDRIFLLKAERKADYASYQAIEFTWNPPIITFGEIMESAGMTPIPPYLNRKSEDVDRERYQTVYSRIKGSVAAPTAGLHFSDSLLQKLDDNRVKRTEVTLHVGAGTFKPVKCESVSDHEMHTEFFSVSRQTIRTLLENYGKILAVGTTTLRTLESLYWLGIQLKRDGKGLEGVMHLKQWEAYRNNPSDTYPEALQEIINYLDRNHRDEFYATTQIIISPGYPIRSIHALITNFHQPRSTLLLLVSAITGENWKKIYRYALEHQFRFLSYGDSSLLYL